MNNPNIPLGKTVTHSATYDPEQLFPIERQLGRQEIGVVGNLPFYGEDLWTAYELSWLNNKGKPVVAVGEFIFPCTTTNIIESKSLKLYCNSFNQSRFSSWQLVQETMVKDLSRITGDSVQVRLIPVNNIEALQIVAPEGECIDELDVNISHYHANPLLLMTRKNVVNHTLHSHLLRTNCPVTNQPDWATIVVKYHGRQIIKESLLAYLISYRRHTGFHENCVEQIFTDILSHCRPKELTVYARFTRRGGMDINPFRSTKQCAMRMGRFIRQ